MGLQYLRYMSLSVGGTNIVCSGDDPTGGMRVEFKITCNVTMTPNVAHVTVTNLSASTSQTLMAAARSSAPLQLTAGYLDNSGVIFQGPSAFAIDGRASPTDTTFQIFARDVGNGRGYDYGVISKALKAGSTPMDHFNAFAGALAPFGITKGYAPQDLLSQRQYPRGVSFFGMVKDHLRVLATSNQCTWSIQQGQMQMVPVNGYVPGAPFVLNSTTGLIGRPTQTFQGIMVRCLINPAINCGSGNLVKIDQSDIQQAALSLDNVGYSSSSSFALNAATQGLPNVAADGLYRVLHIEITGDTRGVPWYMDLTCLAVNNNGVIPQGLVSQTTPQNFGN